MASRTPCRLTNDRLSVPYCEVKNAAPQSACLGWTSELTAQPSKHRIPDTSIKGPLGHRAGWHDAHLLGSITASARRQSSSGSACGRWRLSVNLCEGGVVALGLQRCEIELRHCNAAAELWDCYAVRGQHRQLVAECKPSPVTATAVRAGVKSRQ
jgi:hypothetical protein